MGSATPPSARHIWQIWEVKNKIKSFFDIETLLKAKYVYTYIVCSFDIQQKKYKNETQINTTIKKV